MESGEDLKSTSAWMVGVGASAGGLEALGEFVANIPKNINASFIIAQHLAPHAKSMMVELLSRHSALPVEAVENQVVIEPGHIYVVPPNHDVDTDSERLILTVAGDETRPKPSVDRLFISLARAVGERAVGIILSGSGSDGSDGMRAIKSAGGITIAQDDTTAKYNGMPGSAVQTGQVDYILNPREIGEQLLGILKNRNMGLSPEDLEKDPAFDKIFALVKKDLGTDFSRYKLSTVRRRLIRRMVETDFKILNDYYEYLKGNPKELELLSQELLISVTSFFRDKETFQVAMDTLRQIMDEKASGDDVRIWCAGCATGEEAYSIAMILCDYLNHTDKRLNIKVFATDLDFDGISQARVGIYSRADVEAIPEKFVHQFFEIRNDKYEIRKRIRDLVVFARQDLIQNTPFVKIDFISCRNVMIYFENSLQTRVLEIFHYALRPNGVLFLGKSESVGAAEELFETKDRRAKIYKKRNVLTKMLPQPIRSSFSTDRIEYRMKKIPAPLDLADVAQAQILIQLNIASAVIDESGKIQRLIGDATKYLRLSDGLTDFSVQHLLSESVAVEFQLLLKKVVTQKKPMKSRAFNFDDDKSKKKATAYTIHLSPMEIDKKKSNDPGFELYLVIFEPVVSAEKVQVRASLDQDLALKAAETEHELMVTREHLQTVIEELGVSNEELQSVNEELSSTNEELQASNEELETTNEELQSTNEELTTLNEELNVKSFELRFANTALENIQTSIAVPLLVIDGELRLQRYNPASLELFDVTSNDIGRSIKKVSCRCEIEGFEAKIKHTIATGKMSEATVDAFRAVYQMRIMPSRDENGNTVGAIVVFVNNTELIRAEERLRRSETRIRSIIDGSSSLIFLKDTLGKYLSANTAYLELLGLKEEQVIGKTDREILPERMANDFRNADLETLLRRVRVEQKDEVEIDGQQYVFLSSRFPMMDDTGSTPIAIGTVAVNITDQVNAQRDVQKSMALYKAIVDDQSVFVCRYLPDGTITFVNHSYCNYFGGKPDKYVGDSFFNLMKEGEKKRCKQSLIRLGRDGQVAQFEHAYNAGAATERWIRWINKAIRNDTGDLIEIQAVGFDVTEYRFQTEQMVQREMLFSNIFNFTTDFLTVFRVSGPEKDLILESFNRTVEEGSEFSYAHYIGRNVRDLIPSKNREEILNKYRLCVTEKKPQLLEEELSMQGGTRYLSTTLIPIISPEGEVVRLVALSQDVTRYKQVETDLLKAKESADIANQSKSDFLASMSHELRSPLNVIIGMAQLLETADLSGEEKKQVTSIYRSGRILLNLVEDILDISKIEAGKVKLSYDSFSIANMVNEITESFEYQASEKGVQLNVSINLENDYDYVGDSLRIRQVLTNLVSNAVKFTDKGSINVAVNSRPMKSGNRRIVKFEVKDTGFGISEEFQNMIFQKFSQVESGLNRRFGGSGLGLVISKRLVTLMSGHIDFTSDKGKGSTFWFQLPLSITPHVSKNDPKLPRFFPPKTNYATPAKILAVDDSLDSQLVLRAFLKRLGHEVDVVDGGHAAIELVQTKQYDLVLMDVQMPVIDGYQTTEAIRQLDHPNRDIPIIALTANAMVGDSEKCFEAGMNDYLTKPYEAEALNKMIIKWTGGTPREIDNENRRH